VGATAFVVVLGVVFLGESFGAGRSLGVGLTVLGTWLLARNEAANPRPATA
jgi:drug/metabolite transporter (DMT)-like permease